LLLNLGEEVRMEKVEGPKVVRKQYPEAQLAEIRDRAENISIESRAGVVDVPGRPALGRAQPCEA